MIYLHNRPKYAILALSAYKCSLMADNPGGHMKILFSYFILMLFCFSYLIDTKIVNNTIIGFLLSIATVTVAFALQNSKMAHVPLYLYAVFTLFEPSLFFFLPILLFEVARQREYLCTAFFVPGFLYHFSTVNLKFLFFLILGIILASFLQYLIESYQTLETTYHKMQDDSTELNLLLKQSNRSLIANQDYEIYTATLRERNRIAREIHDNVGHLLSRCILLNGAIQTINQDKKCDDSLHLLQDTLTQAMENIRDSVHNLHDDSINLQENLQALIHDFDFCPIHMEYDITTNVPAPVRYAFISITKEALTNISRHSNATSAEITLREHPAMYQLIIRDNGRNLSKNFSFRERTPKSGIGLVNMSDRVKSLHGIFQIQTKNGFQIFVSIPKPNAPLRATQHQT